MSLRDLVIDVFKILSKHPLRSSIPKETIVNWIKQTYKVDPERLGWHAKRTLGIGGSEIFKAVAFHRSVLAGVVGSHYTAFTMSSVQELVGGKLLRLTPTAPNSNMKRGILNEPLARSEFIASLRKKGYKVEHDKEASTALASFSDESHPWLHYNEDDVLLINNERVLIDYKCPDPDGIGFASSVEEDYVHQLHQGCYALTKLGFPPGKMLLVKYNVYDCEVYPINVQINQETIKENLAAGDYLYSNYILKNRMPEYQPQLESLLGLTDVKKALETSESVTPLISEKLISHIQQLGYQFLVANKLSKAAIDKADSIADQMKTFLLNVPISTEHDEPDVVIAIGGTELKLAHSFIKDKDKMLAFAKEIGVSAEQFYSTTLDVAALGAAIDQTLTPEQRILFLHNKDALIQTACTMGISFEPYYSRVLDITALGNTLDRLATPEQRLLYSTPELAHKVAVTRKKKGPIAEAASVAVSYAETAINMSLEAVVDENTPSLERIQNAVEGNVRERQNMQMVLKSVFQNAINTMVSYQDSESKSIEDLERELNEGYPEFSP